MTQKHKLSDMTGYEADDVMVVERKEYEALKTLNAELLAVAKNAAYVIQLWGGASGSPDSEIMRRLITVIDKAEGR